jgi:predicted DCC family thiol-disulfide oxidoreductase YuxK
VAIVLFDGVCNLCNAAVRFVIARDRHAHFQFAPLTSDTANRALQAVPPPLPDTVVLVEPDGRIYTRSDAALRIARRLAFPWPLAYGLIALPKGVRDWAYDVIARHRYRWFGRRDSCPIPSPAIRDRFLE